jgi:molybdate transport system permease protein
MSDALCDAAARSVAVGAWCTALGLPLAMALGWWLARSRSRFKPVVSTAVFLPLVLPPVVTGLLLLRLFGRSSWFGAWLDGLGLGVPFTFGAAVIAGSVVGLPLYVMAARGAFEAVDPRYEEVSATLGDRPVRTFVRVTLPLAAPGLAAGAVLAFARALGEFGATIVLAGNTDATRTIPIAVYALLDAPRGEAGIGPLVGMSVVVSTLALVGYEALLRWQRRRLEIEGV